MKFPARTVVPRPARVRVLDIRLGQPHHQSDCICTILRCWQTNLGEVDSTIGMLGPKAEELLVHEETSVLHGEIHHKTWGNGRMFQTQRNRQCFDQQ